MTPLDRKLEAHAILRELGEWTIFCCADGTLTYLARGAKAGAKIIKQALPVLHVESREEAEELIGLACATTYVPDDPYRVKYPAVAGPARRMRYSLPDFVHNDVDTLHNVTLTLAALRDPNGRDVWREAYDRATAARLAGSTPRDGGD